MWTIRKVMNSRVLFAAAALLFLFSGVLGYFTLFPNLIPWIDRHPYLTNLSAPAHIVSIYNKQLQWLWAYDIQQESRILFQEPLQKTPRFLPGGERISIQDWDGDGVAEVLYMANAEGWTPWNRLRLLSPRGKQLLYFDIPNLKFSFPGARDSTLLVGGCELVSWQGAGSARPVLMLSRDDGHKACTLLELDHNLTRIESRLDKLEWWFDLRAIDTGGRDWLWAVSRGYDTCGPLLAIFQKGIPGGLWPPADTSGLLIYRFPVDPLYKRMGKSTDLRIISRDECEHVKISQGNPEIHQDYFEYHFSRSGCLLRIDISDLYWGKRRELARCNNLPMLYSRAAYTRLMQHLQVWTGSRWAPVDSTDTLPDSCYYAQEEWIEYPDE